MVLLIMYDIDEVVSVNWVLVINDGEVKEEGILVEIF